MRISTKINVSGCLIVVFLLILKLSITSITAVELTFELPDNAKECFFQDIQKNQTASLEFQVRIPRVQSRNEQKNMLKRNMTVKMILFLFNDYVYLSLPFGYEEILCHFLFLF